MRFSCLALLLPILAFPASAMDRQDPQTRLTAAYTIAEWAARTCPGWTGREEGFKGLRGNALGPLGTTFIARVTLETWRNRMADRQDLGCGKVVDALETLHPGLVDRLFADHPPIQARHP